jgi:hypothetical protein
MATDRADLSITRVTTPSATSKCVHQQCQDRGTHVSELWFGQRVTKVDHQSLQKTRNPNTIHLEGPPAQDLLPGQLCTGPSFLREDQSAKHLSLST